MAYVRQVYGLRERLQAVRDRRRSPKTPASQVAAAVLFTGLLRIPSLNALEPRLREKPFLCLIGAAVGRALCSADTISRALCGTDLESVRGLVVGIMRKAERNKVFREGWYGALRYVALDGWEPFCSYCRHCPWALARIDPPLLMRTDPL